MRAYLELAKKSFQNNLAYRIEYFAGLVNTLVMIFVNIAIWKAIYEDNDSLEGVQFKIVITYIVLGFLMQSIFTMEDYLIEGKVTSGLISSDLLKPVSFRLYVFSYNAGATIFRIVMQLIPALLISAFFIRLLAPFSPVMAVYFVLSGLLGYLVLYNLNFLTWVSSFWFYYTFSVVTIKDALVVILSGALVPLWFMPQWLFNFIKLTPFDSIYYAPITIYLGQVPSNEIMFTLLKQIFWIIILALIGHMLWKAATKRLVVQGG